MEINKLFRTDWMICHLDLLSELKKEVEKSIKG
jgi:hypothetical protein